MPLLTLEELEPDTKISRHTWRMWIQAGKIATIRAGRTLRVAEEDYRLFVEKCRIRRKGRNEKFD